MSSSLFQQHFVKLQVLHRRRQFIKKKNTFLLKSVTYRPNYVWKYNSRNISCRKTKEKMIMKEMESAFESLTIRARLTNVVERRTGVQEVPTPRVVK